MDPPVTAPSTMEHKICNAVCIRISEYRRSQSMVMFTLSPSDIAHFYDQYDA